MLAKQVGCVSVSVCVRVVVLCVHQRGKQKRGSWSDVLVRLLSIIADHKPNAMQPNPTQARVIAMTCTHAALIRSRLVELGFKFDNIVMEEAAQILEIETLIPILLQTQVGTRSCASRVELSTPTNQPRICATSLARVHTTYMHVYTHTRPPARALQLQ